jgi:lipopolysaccharide/colanic/teichoic acid biosynthesis glycosyltransferase
MYQNGIKIVLDKIVALMALLLLSPIFILISLVLFLLQKQIFFIQTEW